MTRFVEDGRLRKWTVDPEDPLPPRLAEITKLTPGEFSVRRGRVALAGLFPKENRSGITDEHVLRLLQTWPEFAWAEGTNIVDLEPYIETTFRIIRGGKSDGVADSLGMSPEKYEVWRDEVAKDLSGVVSLQGLARATGLREVVRPKRRKLNNDTRRSLAGKLAVSGTRAASDQPFTFNGKPIERTGSRYSDFVRVRAARDDPNLFKILLEENMDIIKYRVNGYYLVGAEYDDLMQEAMFGFWKAVRDYDGLGSSFRSFAELCIERQLITAIKTATRRKHTPLNTYISFEHSADNGKGDGDSLITLEDTLSDTGPPVTDIVESSEKLRHVVDILKSGLSTLEHNVLRLYLNGEGETYESMARTLRVDTKTIDNALQRVRRKTISARFDDGF